jgi:hypothetical protein
MQLSRKNIRSTFAGFALQVLLCCLCIGIVCPGLQAQRIATVGSWTAYPSHDYPRHLVKVGDTFYGISKGGLFSYHLKTKQSGSYTTVEGMSQVDPTAIYHDSHSNRTYVGFSDGMVNSFLDPEEGFDYMSDIQRSELYTTKGVNGFASKEELLYIATEFGLVLYDMDKDETNATVSKIGSNPTGTAVRDIQIFGDSIYVAMGPKGIWRAHSGEINITLPSVWSEVTGHNGLSKGNCHLLEAGAGKEYLQITDTVFQRMPNGVWQKGPFPIRPWNNMIGWGDYFFLSNDKTGRFIDPTGFEVYVDAPGTVLSGYADSSTIMIGDTVNGLNLWYGIDSIELASPDGPYNNKVTMMAAGNQEFYVAPEGKKGQSAPADNTDGFWHFSPDEGWHRFNVDDELHRDSVWAEFARCIYSVDDSICYMGSWNHGIIQLKAGRITAAWMPTNSNLNGGIGNSIRVSGLALDRDKNLWATGIVADYNLNVLTVADSVWHPISLTNVYPIGLVIDDYGNKWINNQGQGLTVFNENGTLNVSTDDKVKNLTTENGRGGLPNNSVYAIAKDLRGQIWVGTLEGVGVFANPSAVFNTTFADASCPVIEGFCLLHEQKVNTIAVDGANRKWIGTDEGLFLVNAQGNKQLEHFTTANSPIFSNAIRDIQIDQQTGEIFIGTEKGLVSLMGEAVGGKENSEDLYVYPNPVQGDYDGPIAITGSYKDVEVKITTVSGRLVRSLNALGGQAIWDGNDTAGNRVTPGVYLALVAAKDGSNPGIAKFVVLERPQ